MKYCEVNHSLVVDERMAWTGPYRISWDERLWEDQELNVFFSSLFD